MSEEMDALVENIRQQSAWVRLAFMAGFVAILYFILLPIIIVLVIVQGLFSVLTGASNENLRYFAAALEQYISQLIKFLTYNSDLKPFPFSDFPQFEGDAAIFETPTDTERKSKEGAQHKKASVKKPATKKTSGSKSSGKKATAKKKASKKADARKPEADIDNNDSAEPS